MIKFFCLFTLLCIFSFSNAQRFLEISYENEEASWENEECSWEEENEWNDFDLNDSDTTGKAVAAAPVSIQANSPQDVGAAVQAGIVKIANALGVDATTTGTDVGNIVTSSLNNVQQTPDNVSGDVAAAVTQGVTNLQNDAGNIGNELAGAITNAIPQIQQNSPNALGGDSVEGLNLAASSGQLPGIMSNIVTSISSNADAIGNAIGPAVGDAVNEGKDPADTAGDAVANFDQTIKDNAAGVSDAMTNAVTNAVTTAVPGGATVPQDQIDAEKAQITADLQNSTPEEIDEDRNNVSQAVNDAITTAQGNDATANVAGVINALADQVVAQIQNGNQ